MTDAPRVLRLGPPSEDLDALAAFLRAAAGTDVTITVDSARPFSTPELQLLLAARQDPSGPASVTVGPASPRLVAGLALLGLEALLEVAA